jgi:hypothetical protein
MAWCREEPMAQATSAAHQEVGPGTPRANLRLARGPDAVPPNLRLARGLDAPSSESPPRSMPPRSCGPRAHSPDQSIKCSDTMQAPESKANPRHAGPLTPPKNRITVLFRQPALCGHPQHCAAHSRRVSALHPSKEGGGALERGTDACPAPAQDNAVTSGQWSVSPPSPPALCGHPRRCATIQGTATPSPVLWELEMTRHRHARYCVTSSPLSAQPSS